MAPQRSEVSDSVNPCAFLSTGDGLVTKRNDARGGESVRRRALPPVTGSARRSSGDTALCGTTGKQGAPLLCALFALVARLNFMLPTCLNVYGFAVAAACLLYSL